MKNIRIYDEDFERIADICEANDINTWDVIEALLDVLEDEAIDINAWF